MRKFLSCLVTGLLATTAQATIAPAITFNPATPVAMLANPPFTLGWQFEVNWASRVTGLGVFDAQDPGLRNSYQVGLWNEAGMLLASGTVAVGTSAPLISGFRYAAIDTLTIGPGSYTIGALYLNGADRVIFPGNPIISLAVSPRIAFGNGTFAGGNTLAAPSTAFGTAGPGFFGPNLLIGSVPEPQTWALLITGFGLVGALARRRQRHAA